ncbi:LysE family transporter [Campylobacter curvus]|uniref:LysE family transporter n=1 Tax=Campylobacter curvus TaxID=200 RepID=UPI0018D3FCCA|nr:LysE family transporter [Campylobacter curvus]
MCAGVFSGLSNPKSIIFYLSLFSVVLTPNVNPALSVALGAWMSVSEFLWGAAIVMALSGRRVRTAFGKAAFYIDKLAGVLLGLIGLKLLQSALQRQL